MVGGIYSCTLSHSNLIEINLIVITIANIKYLSTRIEEQKEHTALEKLEQNPTTYYSTRGSY